ncbi:MAG: ATP-binding protein [Synergistaceae bacterium]|nr:ATP-binding protein [Synergistaceae bacterium]
MSLIKDKKIPADKLRRRADLEALGFRTTKGLDKLSGLIGQERAVRSVNFGLSVQSKGYNIFMVGEPGCGRTTYALDELKRAAAQMPAPDDWVYVYNFDDPSVPLAINLPAGKGRELAKEADDAVEELKTALSKAFDNNEFEDNKAQLVKAFQDEVNSIMEELRKWAESKDFSIKRTPQGFVNLPLIVAPPLAPANAEGEAEAGGETDGKAAEAVRREMQQEEFERLSEAEQEALQKVSEEISQKTLEKLRLIREREKELKEKIKELESQICRVAITPILSELRARYMPNEKLGLWLDDLTEDLIANFNVFLAAVRDDQAEVDFSRYEVNAFVSNNPKDGAPVISETNPIYYNLVGKVDYESRQGNLYTDFRRITPGAMHRANGGFLLLDADELLRQFMSWDVLKRVLRYRELSIENLGEQLGYIPVSSLRPEAIPIDMKVVIVGTPYLYYLLNIYDPEFQKVFKIKAEFDSEMPRSAESEMQIARFIAGFVEREGKLHFTAAAVGEVIEWASRLVEDQNMLSTQLNKIAEILVESTAVAKAAGKRQVGVEHVRGALEEKIFRSNMLEEKVLDSYRSGVTRIDTEGSVVGQINGLTVSQLIDHSFGSPVRITANVFMGAEGVVNIEREVRMTGPIHNKGLMILSSYLSSKYARRFPLSVSARIAFEQLYGGLEGDSASSTELYCLLSAIAEIPINQAIAVTGSVDQRGNIQPIGGVNEKIEGFFRYCKAKGLTGKQGVMIPVQNEQHLMLSHEVTEAVKRGRFHIWSVSTIDEGIEILTGIPAGTENEKGEYPAKSVHGRVQAALEGWLERSFRYKKVMTDRVDPPKKRSAAKSRKADKDESGKDGKEEQ